MTRSAIMCILLLAGSAAMTAAAKQPIPLGVDNAGSPWGRQSECPLADKPAIGHALRELGVNFVVYHIDPVMDQGARNSGQTAGRIAALDSAMRSLGLRYTLNNELVNFLKTVEIDPGVNEFAHPDGTHRWDLRMDWLNPLFVGAGFQIPPQRIALIGITYDECEHMQLTCNQFATYPDGQPFDAPFLVDTTGKDMITSYNRLVAKCKWLRTRHYQGRVMPCSEQVWPDVFHIFARAGWTITPKILKENLSSVVMAISLGAALEYEGLGTRWWVTPDLWGVGNYPGHSPQALRSALMMGYWLGAEALYVENLDFHTYGSSHPASQGKSSLISWKDDGSYEVTPYGEVVKEFYTRYVPEHPTKHSWRDYRPRVAIVRLPDGAWGQRGSGFRDRLLGNPEHPSDDISNEWLDIWPILTHGVARRGAISLNNVTVYPEYPWPFFVPIDSVAVFDHLVTGPVLDLVECFIVCGHALSERTFKEISRRVAIGATCVIARRLYEKNADGKLPGKWLIVDSFTDPAVAAALKPYLGPPDVARFRFKDFTLEFRVVGGDKDHIDVRTTK